jgi:hypothetical protein
LPVLPLLAIMIFRIPITHDFLATLTQVYQKFRTFRNECRENG